MSRGPEEQLHRAVVQLIRAAMPVPPSGPYWFHPHNEGKRSKAEAGTARAMGQRSGNPDLWFVWHGEDRRPFAIELKAPGGYPTKNQRQAFEEITGAGAGHYICRSVEEVGQALSAEGVPLMRWPE